MPAAKQSRARMRKLPLVTKDVQKKRADQAARAERIRTLKERRPETWEEIAAFCGVSPRAAQAWQEHGKIAQRNAHRLGEFLEVEFDWLYYGPEEGFQAPHEHPELREELSEIRRTLDRLEAYLLPPDAVRRLRGRLEARGTRRPRRSLEDEPEGGSGTKG